MEQPDILSAIRQIAAERKIDVNQILEAIKDAIKIGYRKEYELDQREMLEVEIDPERGQIVVYAKKTVVKNVEDQKTEISLSDAKKLDPDLKVGDSVLVDITPEGDFGRIAAQTARQVILQNLRESEKESAIKEIEDKIGEIDTVIVQKVLPEGDVICEINRARAVMPKEDRVPTEFYQLGSRLKVLLKSIEEDARGKYVHISRASNEFLEALFRMEVPEIESGSVEIVSIAREPGIRSKVAVKSNSEGIDPIGACVGQKGVRIIAIMNELKLGKMEEKVDIIPWDNDIEKFIEYAVRPAEAMKVTITDKKKKEATIIVPSDQHSLAIGKEGMNAKLAAKLTGWTLNIEGDGKIVEESAPEESSETEETPEAA